MREVATTLNKNTVRKTKTVPRLVNLSPGTREFLSLCHGNRQRLIYARGAWNKYLWSLFVFARGIIKNMAHGSRLRTKKKKKKLYSGKKRNRTFDR